MILFCIFRYRFANHFLSKASQQKKNGEFQLIKQRNLTVFLMVDAKRFVFVLSKTCVCCWFSGSWHKASEDAVQFNQKSRLRNFLLIRHRKLWNFLSFSFICFNKYFVLHLSGRGWRFEFISMQKWMQIALNLKLFLFSFAIALRDPLCSRK